MGRARILLVEDVEDNRELARELLEIAGHEVHDATDGAEALLRAHELLPDLILLDMSLPVVDGWEALRRLRLDPRLRQIPVVALTAHAMAGDRDKMLAAGCSGYIAKPISISGFAREVANYL